ncbi:MAG: hypothetical protein R2710_30870 [Acidimicrobiales bacterium]
MGDLLAVTELPRLASLLWEYRSGFDRLHFLLDTQMLLISNGRDDQLHHMVDLLDEANARMSRLDLEREILLGVGPDGQPPSLRELIDAVDEPWNEIFAEHAVAIDAAVAKTKALVERSNLLIRRVQADLPNVASLLSVGAPTAAAPTAATYGRSGRSNSERSDHSYLFENRL